MKKHLRLRVLFVCYLFVVVVVVVVVVLSVSLLYWRRCIVERVHQDDNTRAASLR